MAAITYAPPRFSRVPWLDTLSDLRAMGRPETEIEHGDSRVDGLYVPHPFGRDSDAMIAIHATRGNGNDGGEITLAISNLVRIDTETPAMDMTLLSNPRRQLDPDEEC